MKQWTAREGVQFIKQFASSVFQRKPRRQTLLAKFQELFIAYVADCKYSSNRIEEALRNSFGDELTLFNPLSNDAKVAVTSTTVCKSLPCLFSNYNGGSRPRDAGRFFVVMLSRRQVLMLSRIHTNSR